MGASSAKAEPYKTNRLALTGSLAAQPVTDKFVDADAQGHRSAKIRSIVEARCARCHSSGVNGPAAEYPLEKYEEIWTYCDQPAPVQPVARAVSFEQRRQQLLDEREGERLALLDWVSLAEDPQADQARKAYQQDLYRLPAGRSGHPITSGFRSSDSEGSYVKIQSLIAARCARCHAADVQGPAAQCPLDSYEQVHAYCDRPAQAAGGMSLTKLAETTHVHLLGFSMMFVLTGLIFSFSSYPLFVRALFAPLALVAQMADISCWWLSRTDPLFARAILVTGGFVALGLVVHIIGSLVNMYGGARQTHRAGPPLGRRARSPGPVYEGHRAATGEGDVGPTRGHNVGGPMMQRELRSFNPVEG